MTRRYPVMENIERYDLAALAKGHTELREFWPGFTGNLTVIREPSIAGGRPVVIAAETSTVLYDGDRRQLQKLIGSPKNWKGEFTEGLETIRLSGEKLAGLKEALRSARITGLVDDATPSLLLLTQPGLTKALMLTRSGHGVAFRHVLAHDILPAVISGELTGAANERITALEVQVRALAQALDARGVPNVQLRDSPQQMAQMQQRIAGLAKDLGCNPSKITGYLRARLGHTGWKHEPVTGLPRMREALEDFERDWVAVHGRRQGQLALVPGGAR